MPPLAGNYFTAGCAPGADPNSPFCAQCVGSKSNVEDGTKCKASADELYYGYAGAFRSRAQSVYICTMSSLSLCPPVLFMLCIPTGVWLKALVTLPLSNTQSLAKTVVVSRQLASVSSDSCQKFSHIHYVPVAL